MIEYTYSVDKSLYPYCYSGVEYARKVLSGEITTSSYVKGACKRFFEDLKKGFYIFDLNRAERYLRLVQLFEHVKGSDWSSKNITYEPWQNFIFMNIMGWVDPRTNSRRFRIVHIEVPRGSGKAHSLTQSVVTPKGLMKWEQIEIGSELYSRDGKICKVIGKTPITKQKVFEVEFSDGSVIESSGEHEWYTSDKNERERYFNHTHGRVPTRRRKDGTLCSNTAYESVRETKTILKTLKKRGESNHAVSLTKPILGQYLLPKGVSPYFIGYWLGNGSHIGNTISVHLEDAEEILSYFKSSGVNCGITGYQKEGNGATIRFKGCVDHLRDLRLYGDKHIPPEWVNLQYNQRLEIVQGLLDSDGTICKEVGEVEFYNGNYSIALGFKILACSLGFKAVLTEKKVPSSNNYKPSMTHYRVSFSARGEIPLFKLKRKICRQRSVMGGHTYADKRYIVDVRETDRYENMFCVQVDSDDNSYLIGDSLIPTHNSLLASQAVLYFLALDNPVGNEISCASTKKESARIVLDSAMAMAKGSKKFLSKTGVKVLAHKIVHKESNSFARALSSDSKSLDGLNDVLTVMDELHAVSRKLFDVIYSGMKKRRDSLMLCITTAGFNTDGVGHSQSEYAKKVATGEVIDEQMFAIIYTIDKGDDIYDINSWKKANPNFGVSVDPITFEAAALKCKEVPADLPNFKVKNLNMWLSEGSAYFSMEKWKELADPNLDIEKFKGKTCFMAIDMSNKIDLSGKIKVFYDESDKKYAIFQTAYIPEETFEEAESDLYIKTKDSELFVTKGSAIDYERFEEEIIDDSKKFRIDSCFFDPWNATQISQNLTKKKVNMVEFPQRVSTLSEPMKALEVLIREKKLKHNGGPLLEFCMANTVAKVDGNENVFPTKSSEKLKIDLAVALIMAIAGWLVRDMKEKSVYETRGVRTL